MTPNQIQNVIIVKKSAMRRRKGFGKRKKVLINSKPIYINNAYIALRFHFQMPIRIRR